MDILHGLVIVLHFIGWAIVLGGALAGMREARLPKGVLHGALTALVTGVLLVGIASAGLVPGEEVDHAKIAVKLVIVLVITALAFVGRKRPLPQTGIWGAIGVLTLANIVIAVFWN